MKKLLPTFVRSLVLSGAFLLAFSNSFASHIIGAELRYQWLSGYHYQVTVYLYGDCSSTTGAFGTLPYAAPRVCLYNGDTLKGSVDLAVQGTGTDVTPVCPDSSSYTTCDNISYDIPGIKKYIYTNTYTFPYGSKTWRLVYEGYNGSASAAGRTAAITNLFNPGSTIMQLIDTLNTQTTRGHNSSPVLTVEPVPFYCGYYEDCYNPGGTDINDTSALYHQPAGDSLLYNLSTPTDATSGGSATCTGPTFGIPTYCTYVPGLDAWTTPTIQPIDAQHPVQCTTGTSFTFDSSTGQLCFKPIEPQRSTVLYNIEEYFHDPTLGPVMTGTIQREMNFLVQTCTYTDPVGNIDSTTGQGSPVDSTHYVACQYTDTFTLIEYPHEADTTLTLTVTATGLVTGLTVDITNNGTNHPRVVIVGNTSIMLPGNYTVYLTYTDNHCPLQGKAEIPFTITVLPVPTIKDSMLAPATCDAKSAYLIEPGGTGKPWTVKVSVDGIAGDTILARTDTASFIDSLPPGHYHLTIFTATSNNCAISIPLVVPFAKDVDTLTYTNPTYCGSPTGQLILQELLPFAVDSVAYRLNGVWQTTTGFVVTAVGTDTVRGLLAGTYDSIYTVRGFCHSDSIGPYVLVNPAFTYRSTIATDPTKHCFCDGTDTIFGLHPGQLDTITYSWTPFGGTMTAQTPVIRLVGADSTVYITGLCEGVYSGFTVRTDSVCETTPPNITLNAPPQSPLFRSATIYGCKDDTIAFTNESLPNTGLTYRWNFGDGYTDTARNPLHVYSGIVGMTYSVTLTITNGICDSSVTEAFTLNNYIHSGFSISPYPFVCQQSPVAFNDTSSGVGQGGNTALSYLWYFGDGNSSTSFNASNTYVKTGLYHVMLIAGNNVPCYDTSYGTIQVDSLSPLAIGVTDSTICRGSQITFDGLFSTIGDTGVSWSFGDGIQMQNVNPVLHSYDDAALTSFNVTLNVLYRACPATTATRTIYVYPIPDLYLGADTSMCPGSSAISLLDSRNMANPAAKWLWNTGETTPGISVKKPGMYYVAVTIDGCSSSDTVNVLNNCYISIPNVFTPNGDGVNDYFFPRQLMAKDLVTFSMSIYNRWGQEVFQTTSTNGRGWDGTFNNLPQPEGVYIYEIDASFGDGQVEHHQGNVTLLR